MSIRLMTPVLGRVSQVLQDYLFAETTLIDTEEGDSIVTPQIPSSNFFDYDRKLEHQFPACTMRGVESIPIDVKPDTFGRRFQTYQRIEVMFHATVAQAKDMRTLEKLMQRYVNGAVRVLAIMHAGLETAGDPTIWGSPNASTIVRWNAAATYGPEVDQGDGSIVRTATLPLDIERTEAR